MRPSLPLRVRKWLGRSSGFLVVDRETPDGLIIIADFGHWRISQGDLIELEKTESEHDIADVLDASSAAVQLRSRAEGRADTEQRNPRFKRAAAASGGRRPASAKPQHAQTPGSEHPRPGCMSVLNDTAASSVAAYDGRCGSSAVELAFGVMLGCCRLATCWTNELEIIDA